jgi:integrative and conjugative element protein (TIGR02256 family)
LEIGDRLKFRSTDGRFGLQIDSAHLTSILGFCKLSVRVETGGILVGFYSQDHNNAIVTAVIGAPADSIFGRNWFYRGVRGLQCYLERLWIGKRHYYLGEWHFHPGGKPTPSRIDIGQMTEIARTPKYRCPEPVLLIIGMDPEKHPLTDCIRVYVVVNSGTTIQLHLPKATSITHEALKSSFQ